MMPVPKIPKSKNTLAPSRSSTQPSIKSPILRKTFGRALSKASIMPLFGLISFSIAKFAIDWIISILLQLSSMVITYYGLSCFKIQSGDTVLAIDPFSKESGLVPPRFESHAVLSTHDHDNHNNIETLASKEEDEGAFKITGPGEYEFRGITVRGIASFHDAKGGKAKGKNTIYVIE